MAHCDDCGTKLDFGGVCPNCHEELFIYYTDEDDDAVRHSPEFMAKVEEQSAIVKSRKRRERKVTGKG